MATSDLELLQKYNRGGAQEAFAELVRRHLDLVYSVALRQVRSPSLAEEVAQSEFLELARYAEKMRPGSILTGWLYQAAHRRAIDMVRKESRRQLREQTAAELAESVAAPSGWESIEPYLDEAMESLDEVDRNFILLRFFENKNLREVGEILGTSESAAQKRVSRAVEQLRGFFLRRGVTIGASGLAAMLSVNAVQSAPLALGSAIAAGVFPSTLATAAAIGVTKSLTMMTLQKALVATMIAAGVGTGVYETYRASNLQKQVYALEGQSASAVRLSGQKPTRAIDSLAVLRQENDQLRFQIAALRKDSQELAQWKAWEGQAAKDPSQKAMLSWLERVDRLNQRMAQTFKAQIPELKLLSDQNWLEATDDNLLATEDDYRKALAELRRAAEKKFVRQTQSALKNYERDHNSQFPTDLAQLRPYLNASIDDIMLQCWRIVPNAKKWLKGNWLVTRKNLADETLDTVWSFNADKSTARPSDLSPLYGETAALKSFTAAYIRANNGREPSDPSQLTPYVTTAEEQFLLQKMIQKQSIVK